MSIETSSPQVESAAASKIKIRFTMDSATAESARALDVDQLRAAVKKDMELLAAHKVRTSKPR